MKSIFNIRLPLATLLAVAAVGGGCSRAPQALIPAPPDGGDAQRLVTVLDYVSSDYARAVQGGTVVSPDEYESQYKSILPKLHESALLGQKLGVTGTPTFFLNGIKIPTVRVAHLEDAIAYELKKAGVAEHHP